MIFRPRASQARPGRPGAPGGPTTPRAPGRFGSVKKILELLVCFLHPVAVILVWIDLATRRNIGFVAKVAWAVCALIPFVPFLYVLTGGELW